MFDRRPMPSSARSRPAGKKSPAGRTGVGQAVLAGPLGWLAGWPAGWLAVLAGLAVACGDTPPRTMQGHSHFGLPAT